MPHGSISQKYAGRENREWACVFQGPRRKQREWTGHRHDGQALRLQVLVTTYAVKHLKC